MVLDALKQMAMADGVLTENEKAIFRKYYQLSDCEAKELFQTIEEELESVQSETEVIDWKHKNGLDFEKYIVSMLNSDYYSVVDWTGDKYCNGVYDVKNQNPDITVKVNLEHLDVKFAIECKWRMASYKNSIYIASENQLKRYNDFQMRTGIPVFFALGIGGTGENPEALFIFPLGKIKYPIAKLEYLLHHKKNSTQLYFEVKKRKLR